MKLKSALLTFSAVSIGLLAGCSQPSVVHTKDGQQIVTSDKPDFDKDSGMVQYKDNGKEMQINKDDVRSVEEVK